MEQNNVKMREMETYAWREEGQQLLDQNSESSTSENQLQGAWMYGGGIVLGGVV